MRSHDLSRGLRQGLGRLLDAIEPALGLAPPHVTPSCASDARLREMLCALGHGPLSLPSSSRFHRLEPTRVQREPAARGVFDEHMVVNLPRRTLRHSTVLPLHRFVLRSEVAQGLNAKLSALALAMRGTTPSVSKTNRGGYQSADDLFLKVSLADGGRSCGSFVELRSIADKVMREVQLYQQQQPPLPPPTIVSSVSPPEWTAWLNVNQSGDANEMHVHDPRCWSGVYFVSDGRGGLPERTRSEGLEDSNDAKRDGMGGSGSLDGCLIFRGGAVSPRPSNPDPRSISDEEVSHAFLPVLPEPGTFWVFPGSVPHCVLPFEQDRGIDGNGVDVDSHRSDGQSWADGILGRTTVVRDARQETARISVAINFEGVSCVPASTTQSTPSHSRSFSIETHRT